MKSSEKGRPGHSQEFLAILRNPSPAAAIRAVTHSKPLLVFWITPEGEVVDAAPSHFVSPPNGDKAVLAHATHKEHLRGRAAMFGNALYVVVYGDLNHCQLSGRQIKLLRLARTSLLAKLRERGLPDQATTTARFIQEDGQDILL
jgi:hypothetical protein